MRTNVSSRLNSILLLTLFSVFTASSVDAQTFQRTDTPRPLRAASLAANLADLDEAAQTTRASRRSDSLLNGALIGAGVGVASGLLLCRAMEPWHVCLDDVGPLAAFAAVGAGAGMGIDALIRGQRRPLYESADGSKQLHAAPIINRRAKGLAVMVTF